MSAETPSEVWLLAQAGTAYLSFPKLLMTQRLGSKAPALGDRAAGRARLRLPPGNLKPDRGRWTGHRILHNLHNLYNTPVLCIMSPCKDYPPCIADYPWEVLSAWWGLCLHH